MLHADPAYWSAKDQIGALVERKISALELLDHAIKRIDRFDASINAVVVRDFERAREAAHDADAALAKGEGRPLLGLPMTVKEAYNVAGLPTTWGMPMFKGWRAKEDALAVARLKGAGAVIIGKTNVPFGLSDWQSYNDIYGTTNNPWDLNRTPGGSSGGAAAALAAGFVSLEIGSDLGGSIRAPAHFCGVFGHKSSYGIIPLTGHVPPGAEPAASGGDGGLPVLGPLARSADDLALALDVLAGPDAPETIAFQLALPPARHRKLKDFRVLMLDTHPLQPAAEPVRAAIARLADRLGKAGSKVAFESPLVPNLEEATRVYLSMMVSFSSQGRPPDYYRQMAASVASLAPDDNSLATERLKGTVLSHQEWLIANTARIKIRGKWRELFREWDVVISPIMPTAAFAHDHAPLDFSAQAQRQIAIDGKRYPYLDQLVWAATATLPGLPATVAPIERSPEGLPIGVQIIGPYLEDRTTIEFAGLVEREFGGFVPPTGHF
ncbi:MAG: amidase [Hyphomicrobiales bacterium]|nr:amidase [Hyphomicrobiales bacterium]